MLINHWKMKKKIGIWMDLDEAVIIDNGKGSLDRIASSVEHYNLKGGYKGGGTQTSSDTKLLKRKNNQLKNYFDKVMDHVRDADTIVVFGPSETKNAFTKELEETYGFEDKLSTVETSDKMTDKQLIEWVQNYFSKKKTIHPFSQL